MKRLAKILTVILALAAVAISASAAPTAKNARKKTPKITVERPDMDKIKAEVTNPKSKFYYPKLMAMYEKNDTTMTHEQYRYLYLGYMFQEDYDPYRPSSTNADVDDLYHRADHNKDELDAIIEIAEAELLNDPFNLRQMDFLIYALDKRKKVNRAKIWQYRLNHLIGAILSTGTGVDMENAWIIASPKDGIFILNSHGYVADNIEFMPPYYDYVTLVETTDDKSPKGYYFNLKYILDEYYRKYPEQLQQ